MKLFIVLAALALARAAKLDRTYLPPNAESSAGSNLLETPREPFRLPDQNSAFDNNGFASRNAFTQDEAYSGFKAIPERTQAAFERNAAILRQDNYNDGETYAYAYETENGIYGEENGVATNGVQAQGGYSYTGDDGKIYSVRYTADENGFQPQGDHLPTPPPVPAEILQALEQNARDEAAGIFDDGSYNEVKYDNTSQQQYYNTIQSNDADSFVNNNAFSRNSATESGTIGNGFQEAYHPLFAQHINQESKVSQATFSDNALDGTGSGSAFGGVQRAYLQPFAQGNNQRKDVTQATFNNDHLIPNDDARSGNSIAGVQGAYSPPFAYRNNEESEESQAIFNNIDFEGNDGSIGPIDGALNAYLPPFSRGNSQRSRINQRQLKNNAIAGIQKAYLPPFGQRNNQESIVTQASFHNNALAQHSASGSSNTVAGFQNTYLPPVVQQNKTAGTSSAIVAGTNAYLPPFAQRNNQESLVPQATFNNNAIAGIQKAYLPPFAQRNNQERIVTQTTFHNNASSPQYGTTGSSSAVPGFQNAYLPPVIQQTKTAGTFSSISGGLSPQP